MASNLDAATVQRILAMRSGQQGVASGGGTVWYDPNLTTDDPNGYILHNYAGRRQVNGGDAEQWAADPSLDQNFITKLRPDTGGKVGDQWDLQGNYLGEIQLNDGGGRDFNQGLLLMAPGVYGAATAGAAAPVSGTAGIQSMAAAPIGGEVASLGTIPATAGTGGMATAAGAGAATAGGAAVGGGGPVAGAAGTAMGMKDWVALANTGAAVLGAATAGDAAEGATAAAERVANQQLGLSNEALDWYKQIWNEQAPERAAAAQRATDVSNAQVRLMTTAADQADELYNYNKTTFRPVEERLVSEAMNYDTPERRMSAAASAAADIDTSAAAARQASDRALARSGIAPGSTKALALAEDSTVRQAVARGSAQTNAVRQVEQQGHARMADAAALGRGIATQQATQQQIATITGNNAVKANDSSLAATQSGNATMGQGFQTAMTGLNAAGNLFSSVANTQTAQNGQLLNGIGQIGQFAGSYLSDKTKKKGTGRMANAAESLKQVEATPVHEGWQYDPAKGGPDDGGKPHTGPMAQDVQRTMGEAAAPGGKAIDVATVTGRMMSAIQELSRRVKKLEHEDTTEAEAA